MILDLGDWAGNRLGAESEAMKHDLQKWSGSGRKCIRCGVVPLSGKEDGHCEGYPEPPAKIQVGRFTYVRSDLVD